MKNILQDRKPFIIADVGSNWKRYDHPDHNLALALRHIDDAKFCGCDAVKFQFFTYKELYGIEGPNEYALPYEFIPKLATHASIRGIEFMCTAFSAEGAKFINHYVNIHKVASSDIQYWDLLNALFQTGKPIIYSTGGASDIEIENLLAKVMTKEDAILECVASYPAKPEHYDLVAMKNWKIRREAIVGVSDHTTTDLMAIAAVGMGATIFEKHFDALQIDEPYTDTPDAPFSIGPQKLLSYCSKIRDAYQICYGPKGFITEEEPMRLRWKRRLKICAPINSAQDTLQNGVNFGLFRSLSDDARSAGPQLIGDFEGKRVKNDMKPQDSLWYDDIL
jgi:sialic acid synthase SpsE